MSDDVHFNMLENTSCTDSSNQAVETQSESEDYDPIHPFSSFLEYDVANWLWDNDIHTDAAKSLLKLMRDHLPTSEMLSIKNYDMMKKKFDLLVADCVRMFCTLHAFPALLTIVIIAILRNQVHSA